RETELQALDLKYQKAMCGMMRLDEAWKLSKTQTREAQDAQQAAEQRATDEKQRGDELQRQLEAANQRETTLASRVDTLVQEKLQTQQQRNEKEQGAKDREMQVHELRAQLETMRHQFDTQMKQQEGAMREDVRRLQEELQKAEEQEELIQKQKRIEEELVKKKQAVEETEQRLTKESQGMLQAQEETWSCREKFLQEEADNYKQKLARMQTFHVELAQLLQIKDGDNTVDEQLESVEPAMLKALIVQEIDKRDVLTTKLGQMKLKLGATKRQLTSQKQLEAENTKLRAEYEKAKLAMERMATRKAKSFASVTSLPVQQRSCPSERNAGKENRLAIIKRQLDEDEAETIDLRTTPRKAQRTKHVYVASRYLSK
ncbi:hypothetical protein PC110_g22806, partial [Phytophthora cactorum]